MDHQSLSRNQNKSLSAFTLATLIEVTKCGRRQIVYEDPKTLKQKTVDPKKVIREGFDCFKDGFEGNSYLAVMVFRLGRFRSFSQHFRQIFDLNFQWLFFIANSKYYIS